MHLFLCFYLSCSSWHKGFLLKIKMLAVFAKTIKSFFIYINLMIDLYIKIRMSVTEYKVLKVYVKGC